MPLDYAMMQIRKGVSESLPQMAPAYERENVQGFRAGFGEEVVNQVRGSAVWTLMDMLEPEVKTWTADQEKQIEILSRVLNPFAAPLEGGKAIWPPHYEDFWAVGRYLKHKGNKDAAKQAFDFAVGVIQEDTHIDPNGPKWRGTIGRINDEKAAL